MSSDLSKYPRLTGQERCSIDGEQRLFAVSHFLHSWSVGLNFLLEFLFQRELHTYIQWNLRKRDTLGLIILSLVERLSLSQK